MTDGKPTFEQNLGKLQKYVGDLEEGELPLKETIDKFEDGLKLVKYCSDELNEAEQKIEKILEKNGKPVAVPFEE